MSRSEEVIPKLEKHKLSSLISKGERIDGRELNEYRPITIDVNCIEKAEGSAIVSLGNTVSIAGVKAEIGTPFADTPNEGVLIVITDEWVPLPIRDRPVPVTMAKIGDKLVVDPNINEELSMDCRLTLTVNERGSICAVQKGGRGSLSMNDILYAVDLALKVSKEIRSALPPLPKIEDITYVVK